MGGNVKLLQFSTFSWEICTWNVPLFPPALGLCPVCRTGGFGWLCPSGDAGGSHGFHSWKEKLHLGFSMPIPESVLAAHTQSIHS